MYTFREEEEKMLHEMMVHKPSRCLTPYELRKASPKKSPSKGLNIPFTSKYPLFDQIVADQEKRYKLSYRSYTKPIIMYIN